VTTVRSVRSELEHLAADQASDAGGATPAASDGEGQAPAPVLPHQPHGENAQHGDAPAAGTTADTPATGAAGDGTGPPAGPVAAPLVPSLPANWSDTFACATYLLRFPTDQLAAALGPDDVLDLYALYDHIGAVLATQQAKEQNA